MKGAAVANRQTREGVEFGPTGTGKLYLSAFHHRGTRNVNKTCWRSEFTPEREFGLFAEGDGKDWFCADGHLWCIADGGRTVLGKGGERIGFCPHVAEPVRRWHGYPVRAVVDYDVPEEVVCRWEEGKEISPITARRIRGGKY